MMQNSIYQAAYLNYLCQWIQNDFSLAAMEPKIDSIADVIRPYVYADPNKQFTNANFDSNIDFDMGNIPGIKDFISVRRASLNTQLQQFGCSPVGVENYGEEKWQNMLEHLEDPDKILWTYNHVIPNFLNIAIEELVEH